MMLRIIVRHPHKPLRAKRCLKHSNRPALNLLDPPFAMPLCRPLVWSMITKIIVTLKQDLLIQIRAEFMSNNIIHAYAAMSAGAALEPYQFDAGELQPHQVEVKVEYCGLCHSDISILNNDWGSSVYPVVAGHEIIGIITQLGGEAKGLKVGQRVGIGWTAESCQYCDPCISGQQVLCTGGQVATIV